MSDENTNAGLPPPEVTQQELETWFALQKQLEIIKNQEMALRKKIFAGYFTAPEEGTNTAALSGGWVLKGQHKIDRKVETALLTNMDPTLRKKGLPMDDLIKWKPEVAITEYRKLTEAQRLLFDQVLIIKPGAPALEIVLPKRQT